MDILSFNISWMAYNLFLAFVAVGAGWLLVSAPKNPFTIFIALIWILFIPNTIYIITDIEHLFRQWKLINNLGLHTILLGEYGFLIICGLGSYILAYYPIEKFLSHYYLKKNTQVRTYILICFNFLIGLGIVLGRIERVNSWWVFTQIQSVASSIHVVFTTPSQLVLAFLFGAFANYFYFVFRKPILQYFKIIRKRN